MNRILVQHEKYAYTYIDNVVLFSTDSFDHLQQLTILHCKLYEMCIRKPSDKISKIYDRIEHTCVWLQLSSNYRNLRNSEVKERCQKPIGLLSYYRSHIATFSDIARPLLVLTNKRKPYEISLSKQCEKVLCELKQAISKSPIYYSSDFRRSIMQTLPHTQ